jgi:hypothetical protein
MQSHAREFALCLLVSLAIALCQWWPMIADPAATGFGDWQMIHHNWEAAYISLSRFSEWPLWDPFHCGGVSILGNPESQLYAPWFWLSWPFGTVVAVKLMLLGHMAVGLLGMYWLARGRYALQVPSAALAAIAWLCGGCFVWDGAGGHATFLPFTFAPWLSYCVHRNQGLFRDAACVAALLTLTLFEGGTYPLPFFCLWLVFEWTLHAWHTRRLGRELSFAAISFGLLGVCGALRWLPVYLALEQSPRTVPNDDALTLPEVWTMLTQRWHAWPMPGHPFVWPEYGSYVGMPVVGLAMLGALLALRRGRLHLLAGLLVFGGFMLGNVGRYAPFSLLHGLPIYDSLRVPSRFAVFFTFYVALLAAHALDTGLTMLRRPRLSAAIGGLATLGILIDLNIASAPIVQLWREPALFTTPAAANFYLVGPNYYGIFANFPRLNIGTPGCYAGGMNWPISNALWLGRTPQLRVPSSAGRVLAWQKTPNTFTATLELHQAARVVFNQNFSRGFVSNIGTPIADAGRLALDVPAGTHALELRYRPREFLPCAAVSGIGLGLLAWLMLRRRGTRQRQAAAASGTATSNLLRSNSVAAANATHSPVPSAYTVG